MANKTYYLSDYLDATGQIINILAKNRATAGYIYREVKYSQPIVSKKLARLQDEGVIVCKRDPNDRRVVWYEISAKFRVAFCDNFNQLPIDQPLDSIKRQV